MSDHDDRETIALDTLIASFHCIVEGDGLIPLDDPTILSDEDRRALEALGDDLIDRLLEQRG